MSREQYDEGWADGKDGRDPNTARLNYGARHINDYERGYIDSGVVLFDSADAGWASWTRTDATTTDASSAPVQGPGAGPGKPKEQQR